MNFQLTKFSIYNGFTGVQPIVNWGTSILILSKSTSNSQIQNLYLPKSKFMNPALTMEEILTLITYVILLAVNQGVILIVGQKTELIPAGIGHYNAL